MSEGYLLYDLGLDKPRNQSPDALDLLEGGCGLLLLGGQKGSQVLHVLLGPSLQLTVVLDYHIGLVAHEGPQASSRKLLPFLLYPPHHSASRGSYHNPIPDVSKVILPY